MVAGGAGSDAKAEAVDGRAKAMQLDVVDDEEPVEAIRVTLDCHTHLSQRPFVFTTSKRRIRTVGATKRVVTPDAPAGLASACR